MACIATSAVCFLIMDLDPISLSFPEHRGQRDAKKRFRGTRQNSVTYIQGGEDVFGKCIMLYALPHLQMHDHFGRAFMSLDHHALHML